MKDEIVEAFRHASQGFSPDRGVVDPDLNRACLSECSRLGLGSHAAQLNRSLLNLRKRGALRGLSSRRTILRDRPDYRFAAEIAARFLERESEITLGQIIGDPQYGERFDEIAKTIMPAGESFEFRWDALNLRKQQRLKPELLARVARPRRVLRFKVDGLSVDLGDVRHQKAVGAHCVDLLLLVAAAVAIDQAANAEVAQRGQAAIDLVASTTFSHDCRWALSR